MPEIQKYNLNEKLNEANEKYKNSPAVCGMSSMTHYRYNNSTRTQMFTAHLNQVINMKTPQFPLVMTGAENTVGKHSSYYKKMKHDSIVYRRVDKYKDLLEHPFVSQIFYWDTKKEKYDVIMRKEAADLGQNYGVKYNNDVIDSLHDGDKISAGTVLYRSTSYDENMNYRFGANLRTMYTFDPWTAEDSAEISEYASEVMTTWHSQVIEWGWNNNDIPLNLYGDDDNYQPLANLGEKVEGIIASSRPQINDQLAYDFKKENLRMSRDGDREITFFGTARVVDYDIFCNNYDLKDNSFNHQIITYLNSQRVYWQEIQDTCLEIINSGKNYSRKIDDLYDRSIKFLDQKPNERWYDGNSTFGNLKIRVHVISDTPLCEGGKFTARFGNKSVVSRVVPNHLMPFDADGNRVDVLLHLPAITNRTTGFVPHELYINWCTEMAVREMAKMDKFEDREKLMWDIVKDLNKDQYEQFHARYMKLNKKEKEEYIESVMENGIIIHNDSINEDESIFYKLLRIRDKYEFLKPQTLYQYKWGRIYRIAQKACPGKMYFMPLKQTDQRGFSCRNTGAVNMKGLPERSYKNKRNEAPFSDTAIRFGEYETLNFLIGTEPEDFAMVHAFYRSSPEATSDLTKSQFVERGMAQFKPFYHNRAAEIFNVLYKHLGLELDFNNQNMKIKGMDHSTLTEHTYKGRTYIMTDADFNELKIRDEVREAILDKHVIMEHGKLEEEVEKEMAKLPSINGRFDPQINIFGNKDELTDD